VIESPRYSSDCTEFRLHVDANKDGSMGPIADSGFRISIYVPSDIGHKTPSDSEAK